jgi:DNA/RNA-binding domain of Phe-tRNA-synthetase-like protein
MELKITETIFAKFPEAILGIVLARNINNSGTDEAIARMLEQSQSNAFAKLQSIVIAEHPNIVPWRDAYRAFGAKPKDHPSSIENLMRRVQKGSKLPHINKLVDLYNTVSLDFFLPVGGEDLERIEGDLLLTIAGENESPVSLLGEPEPRAPKPGEVFYKDNLGAVCRRWNWKEADRTKLTEQTRNAILVIEGLPPVPRATIEEGAGQLAERIRQHCGGEIRTVILDRDHSSTQLE